MVLEHLCPHSPQPYQLFHRSRGFSGRFSVLELSHLQLFSVKIQPNYFFLFSEWQQIWYGASVSEVRLIWHVSVSVWPPGPGVPSGQPEYMSAVFWTLL